MQVTPRIRAAAHSNRTDTRIPGRAMNATDSGTVIARYSAR